LIEKKNKRLQKGLSRIPLRQKNEAGGDRRPLGDKNSLTKKTQEEKERGISETKQMG
jgi:hypothetical protein